MSLTLICYRSVSHPLLSFSDEKALKLSAEYDVSMEEVLYPIDMFQIKVMKPFISKKNIDYNYKFMSGLLLFLQLNYQREQVAAIKEKQIAKQDGDLPPQEKPQSATVTETSLVHSMTSGNVRFVLVILFFPKK